MTKATLDRKSTKAIGRPRRIGVAKGFGPRHAENAGEGSDLTKVSTDVVPAMLTPKEAVLNRNASELAGRGNIEKLNRTGNQLAKKGVDLAAKGDADVDPALRESSDALEAMRRRALSKVERVKGPQFSPEPGSPAESSFWRQLMDVQGVLPPEVQMYPDWIKARKDFGLDPLMAKKGETQVRMNQGGGGKFGAQAMPFAPMPGASALKGMGSGSFYPAPVARPIKPLAAMPRKPYGYADGTKEIAGDAPGIASGWGPMPTLTGADISRVLQAGAKEHGLSGKQVSGLMSMFQQAGGMAQDVPTYGEGSSVSQALGPALESAYGGAYQGGISDIGYPPFVAPQAEYHADKGSNWIGAYDPAYVIPRYAHGTSNVRWW